MFARIRPQWLRRTKAGPRRPARPRARFELGVLEGRLLPSGVVITAGGTYSGKMKRRLSAGGRAVA